MQPNPTHLLNNLNISNPLIGFYDTPEKHPFEPFTSPGRDTTMHPHLAIPYPHRSAPAAASLPQCLMALTRPGPSSAGQTSP